MTTPVWNIEHEDKEYDNKIPQIIANRQRKEQKGTPCSIINMVKKNKIVVNHERITKFIQKSTNSAITTIKIN